MNDTTTMTMMTQKIDGMVTAAERMHALAIVDRVHVQVVLRRGCWRLRPEFEIRLDGACWTAPDAQEAYRATRSLIRRERRWQRALAGIVRLAKQGVEQRLLDSLHRDYDALRVERGEEDLLTEAAARDCAEQHRICAEAAYAAQPLQAAALAMLAGRDADSFRARDRAREEVRRCAEDRGLWAGVVTLAATGEHWREYPTLSVDLSDSTTS